MKAIVIGGGIVGPIAAIALKRAGIQAGVYEAHDGPADALGLFLGLGVNGMRVLRHLDLLEPVMRADTIPTPDMTFSSGTGKRLGVVSNGWLDSATPSITLMRGVLQRVLAEEAQARGIQIHYGARFTGYAEEDGHVVAGFDDGSEAEGNILIGADGIRSRVREVMTPDGVEPSYTGLINLGGAVRDSGMSPTPDMMHMVWGRRAFFGYTVRLWWGGVVVRQRRQ
jgi:2-polyprenyl-6-methoxyphenol hydroxylase-like FAD-dependent oxidoreductase